MGMQSTPEKQKRKFLEVPVMLLKRQNGAKLCICPLESARSLIAVENAGLF
jgi:hypothetical protein